VEGKKGIWFIKLSKKEVRQLNKNIVIFAFFLFIAFVFWYINSLGKEIKGEFRFSASLINIPKGRAVTGENPLKLLLEIKGQGYTLIKYRFSNQSNLVVDFSKVTIKRIPETAPARFFVLSSGMIPNFKKQLGNVFDIISVKPDTIFLGYIKDVN
jgi:hypothetical protein